MPKEKTDVLSKRAPYGLGTVTLVIVSCMLLFMLNNGIRSNFGLISSAVSRYTGLADGTISLAVAIAQLLYGLS